MLKIAICDDDLQFSGKLEKLIVQESRTINVRTEIEVFSDGKHLVENIQSGKRYNLIFIDIEMEEIDGISAARYIRIVDKSVLLIYISGYDNYLKELFEVEPFRFLSKPLDSEKFRDYFREACLRIGETEVYFQFTFNKELQKVPLNDIVYFESHNRLIYIHLKNDSCIHFYSKLSEVEKELASSRKYFLRIHQSFLVNYNYVKKMNFFSVIVHSDNQEFELKISQERQKEIRRHLCEIAGGKVVIE